MFHRGLSGVVFFVCGDELSTLNMIFTLFWVSTYLHRHWISPKIWIQEKVIYTDYAFHLQSDLTKKLSKQTIPLPGQI